MKENELMKISELSRRTGFPASTIRYYTLEGLLPPPIKTGKTRAYYSKAHQHALNLIKVKQDKEEKPLAVIKEEMKKDIKLAINDYETYSIPNDKKEEILSNATKLFLKQGYANTSIADIANQARMSKETIYLNYSSKEEIFMACADRIFHEIFENVWSEIKDEKDISLRLFKRGQAFLASYHQWINMMNLVRHVSVGNNRLFKEKFRQLLQQLVGPLVNDMEKLKRNGLISQDIDSTLAGYMLLGMAEYGALYAIQENYSKDEILKALLSFIR